MLLRVALVLVVAGSVLQLQSAGSYMVTAGSVTFQLRPAWPGGHLVMPLGPAGELSLHAHRSPADVIMGYRLPAQTAALLGDCSEHEVPRLEGGARAASGRYLSGRVPWLVLVGAAAGLLVAGVRRRRLMWGAAGGVAAALLLGAASPTVTSALEPAAASRDVYTYQLIDFSRADPRRLVTVTTVSYAGGGRTVVTYTPFGG